MKTSAFNLFGALLTVALATTSARAAGTDTWVGNTDVNWNTAANWTTSGGSTPPASGDSLVFGAAGSSGLTLNNNITGLTVSNLAINGPGAFTFGGNNITLNGQLTNAASVGETFSLGIAVGPNATIKNGVGSGTLAFGAFSRVAGGGGWVNFVTNGPITTTTANNNGILGGWATFGNAGTAGASGDWAANDGSGNVVTYTGYTTVSGSTNGAGASASNWLDSDGTASLTASANVNSLVMRGDFNIQSGATLTLNSGGLLFSGASKWFKNNGAGSIAGTAQITSGLASGELFVDSSGSPTSDADWRIWPKIVDNGATPVILVKNGPGFVRLMNANTYSGGTILNGGRVLCDNATSALGTGPLTINGNVGIWLNVNLTTSGALRGAGTLDNTVGTGGASWNINGDLNNFTGTIMHFCDNSHNNLNLGGGTANSIDGSKMKVVLSGNNGQARKLSLNGFGVGNFLVGDLSGSSGSLNLNNSVNIGYLNLNSTFGGWIMNGANSPAVTKVGTGSLTLSGASTYPGVTTIENGALIAGANVPASGNGPFGNATSAIALGDATSEAANQSVALYAGGAFTMARPVTVGAGNATTATFTLGGNTASSSTISGAIALNQNLVVTQAVGGTLTLSGVISENLGGMAVTKVGGGTAILSGSTSYSGLTAVNNGALMSGIPGLTSAAVTVADGATAGVSATADATYWLPSSLTVGSSTGGTLQFNLGGTITGPNANTLLTPTSLTLNGTTTIIVGSCPQVLGLYPLFNNYSSGALTLGSQPAGVLGKLTVSSGTVYYEVTNFVTAVWTAAVNTNWDTVTANWTNTIGGNKYVSGYPVLLDDTAAGAGPLLVNIVSAVTPNSVTINNTNKAYVIGGAAIGGATGLTKNGNNTLTLTGTNTFTGNTTVSAGTLEIGGAGQLGGGSYAGNMAVEGTLKYNSTAAQTLAGSISGNGALINSSTNTLTLSAANSFIGGVTNNAGTIALNDGAALGTGPLTLNGGSVINVNSGADLTVGNDIVVGSGGAISLGVAKNLWLNGTLSGSGNLTLGGSTPLASLNVNFAANNLSAPGTITIPPSTGNNQTVVRLKSSAVGNAGIAWSIGGAQDRFTTLDFNGTIDFGALTGVGTIAGNGAGTRTVQVGALNVDSTFAGRFLDNGGTLGLNKLGTGKLTLTGANSIMTGGVNLSAGILNLGGANTFSATTPITFSGGLLQYSAANQADYSAQFANSASPISIDLNGTNVTFASAIPSSNYGGLALTNSTGAGKLTFTANSLYSGDTLINAGTLALSGSGNLSGTGNIIVGTNGVFDVSAATAYTLGSAQTLSGIGTVTGAVTTASTGATISPAGSGVVGTLTFKSNLTMNSGGSAVFDLSANHLNGNDQVAVNGNLNLSVADTIHINAMTGGGNLDETGDYVLFTVTGTLMMGSRPVLVFDNTPPADASHYVVQTSGNNVALHYYSVPPPLVNSVVVTNVADGSSVATRGQSVTVYVTVQQTANNISSVVADLSQIGGSASQILTADGSSGSDYYYTSGPIVVGPGAHVGTVAVGVSATDTSALIGTGAGFLTVNATTETWNGLAADNNWGSDANWVSGLQPGYSGDTLIFTGSTRLSPNLQTNYDVAGLTFDGSASSFTIGSTSGKSLALSGALNNSSASPQIISAAVVLNSGASVSDAGSGMTLSGTVSGSGLAVSGGTVTLSGANTYTGNTTISAGSLKAANSAAIPSGGGKGNVVVSSGAMFDANGTSVSMNGLSDAGTVDNTAAGAATLTLGNGNATTIFTGTIQNTLGDLSLVKVGAGAFTISKNNTYAGTTRILGGSVVVPNGAASAFSTNSLTLSNATLVVQAGGGGSWANANAVSIGNNLIAPAGTTNVIDDSVNNFGNLWVGGDNVQWTGTGTIKFQNNGGVNNPGLIWNGSPLSTFNGTIVLGSANGTNSSVFNGLAYSATAGGGIGAAVTTFDSAGTAWNLGDVGYSVTQVADAGCTTVRMGSISGSNTNTILRGNNSSTPSTFEVGALNTSTTFGGKITDFGAGGTALTKVGAGTLTLTSIANSYTGPTTVSNGTLLVNGALTSPVTVAGGTFGGTGSVTANVAVNSGGTLSPGASIGTLTINGNLSLSGNAVVELNKSLSPAQSNDFVDVSGALSYGGTLTVNNLGPALAAGDSFRLFPSGGVGSVTVVGSAGSGLAYSFNDGLLSVVSGGPTGPGVITNSISGNTLTLTWPSGQGWTLEAQTNNLSTGLSPTGWSTVSGVSDGSATITIDPTKPTVFYRLVYP